MAIAEIKWKLVKDTYFFDTTSCYLSEDGNRLFYVGKEKRIEILINDLNELVRKGCAVWLELGEYEFGLDKLSKCPTTTWYSIHQMLYSLEPWGVMKESKESARKSIKESRQSILDKRFYELVDEGYIYDEDEDGMNMSYGELVAVSDDLWETLEDELKYYDDFQEAYDVYMDIMDNTSDDAKMFMTGSDEYFYFEVDEDEGTYSVDGEVPFVLEKLFKQFQKNTDLVRR